MLPVTRHNYGLFGARLAHSFSKAYFEEKFAKLGLNEYHYDLYELSTIDVVRDIVAKHQLSGFNVTIPYKETVLPYLDSLDAVAKEIGAVNTVKVIRDTNGVLHLCGYNTDALAFLNTLKPLLKPWHTSALILGTGGASKAVAWALRQLGIDYLFVSRTPERHSNAISYSDLKDSTQPLIINTTPVGMFPNVNATAWPYPEILTTHHLCYDLIYNPATTEFLSEASKVGASTQNGLAMLHRQADLAFDIWQR